MNNNVLWQQDNFNKKYLKLTQDIDADILIIGGGITGVSTFYNLKELDEKVILVEKNKIGFGATSRSTAKITFLQDNIYSRIFSLFCK